MRELKVVTTCDLCGTQGEVSLLQWSWIDSRQREFDVCSNCRPKAGHLTVEDLLQVSRFVSLEGKSAGKNVAVKSKYSGRRASEVPLEDEDPIWRPHRTLTADGVDVYRCPWEGCGDVFPLRGAVATHHKRKHGVSMPHIKRSGSEQSTAVLDK